MNAQIMKVSVLHGNGSVNPEFKEIFSGIHNCKLWKEARNPETFLAQHQETPPDLALVDLDGTGSIPDWLEPLIARLPQTEIMVCSHSRDPDFLIKVMKLRTGGFIPLPLNRQEFLTTLGRLQAEKEKPQGQGYSQILAVTGTKGGVGTTSIATNLAVALAAAMPGGVILVDLARPFAHVGQFLDLECKHTIKDLVESADNLDPVFVKKIVQKHKSKLEVLLSYPDYHLEAPAVPDPRSLDKIFATLRKSYTWVVVDMGIWLDQFYARVLQEADQILLVTQLALPDLQNMKAIRVLFSKWDLDEDKVKVLVNRYAKNYALGLKDIENVLQQPISYTLPSDFPALNEAINQGEPLGTMAPRSKLWRRLEQLAGELASPASVASEAQRVARPGLLHRLF
jgi:pilus assembly protein CpaE